MKTEWKGSWNLLALGGGSLALRQTLSLDREIVRLSGKSRPEVLFLPTASGDDPAYRASFREVYEGELGCRYRELLLCRDPPSVQQIRTRILMADILYIGGGNTLMMMNRLRKLGVDQVLREAADSGKVLCGTSAGALCWFRFGHSDSRRYRAGDRAWDYIRVRGLGFIPATGCPHYHEEGREGSFERMLNRFPGWGIALDNGAALHIRGNQYRILRSLTHPGKAYRIRKLNGGIFREELGSSDELHSLQALWSLPEQIKGSGR